MLNRRDFLRASSAIVTAAALSGPWSHAYAQAPTAEALRVDTLDLEVNGKLSKVFGIIQPNGRPGFAADTGTNFRVRLDNKLAEETLVHWHGLTPPSNQDGVPGLSQDPIPPGMGSDYDFLLTRSGTYWMHSHVGLQEQRLLAAPLIIFDPADAKVDEQQVVVMLHDFTFRDPAEIFEDLRKGGGMSIPGMRGHAGPMSDGGSSAPTMKHGMGNMGSMPKTTHGKDSMAGMAMDINDVEYDAYLANYRSLHDPQIVRVESGGRVRLRIINGSAATNFHIDLGDLRGDLIAVDGDPIAPLSGSRFEVAIAQRADIRVRLPSGPGSYPILALREGALERTGIVLATTGAKIGKISPKAAKASPVLALDLERSLRAATPLEPRHNARTIPVELGGDMMRYDWRMNGEVYGRNTPLKVIAGERVEIVMSNASMMSHPMHLHGHHFQVVAIDGERFSGAMRDTVLVPPMKSVTIAFDANNPGRWAFHCHNLYHMQAGMMGEVRYVA
jgi:FtsP/CotA-like multicopper oxidase with cupredoxin domain